MINFVILAFVIFWMVRKLGAMKSRLAAEAASPSTPEDVVLLREIRDLLRR